MPLTLPALFSPSQKENTDDSASSGDYDTAGWPGTAIEEGDTEGTFAISSTTSSSLLLTSEETVIVTTWNDVEAGKITQTEISGETTLLLTFDSTNTQSSEFTTISTLSPGPDSSSAGLTSASTTIEMTIEGLETTSGTLTTIENPGSLLPPPNTIITEGETTTTGDVYSTFHYEETGTSSDSYTNAPYDVDMTSNYALELDSTTDIDILSTETSTSEWTLLNYGDEEEEVEVVGFAITNIDGVTTLDYDSDFGFVMSTTVETSGTNSTNEVLTAVLSTSVSEVDSTHTTHDTYQVERELVEGEVVETSDSDYTGSFLTEALQGSSTATDVDGEFHYEEHPYTWPGPGPGPSTDIEAWANQTFEDHRQTTTTMSAEQSGSYGDGEEDSSSSEFSITSADEYYSNMAGDHYWESTSTGIVMEGSYTSHEEGSSERVFAETKDFTPEGNSATWSTSFERERSWEVHTEGEMYGYATIFEDSGTDSYSESSGGQTYEPGEEDNPSNGYGGGDHETHGGGGSGGGGEGGEGELGATADAELRGALKWFDKFFANRATGSDRIQKLPYFSDGNNEPMTKDLKWYSWMDDGRDLLVLTVAGDENSPATLGKAIPKGWEFSPRLFNGQKMEFKIDGTGVSEMDINKAKAQALKQFGFKGNPNGTWHHRSTKDGRILMQFVDRAEHAAKNHRGGFAQYLDWAAQQLARRGTELKGLTEAQKEGIRRALSHEKTRQLMIDRLRQIGIEVAEEGSEIILTKGGKKLGSLIATKIGNKWVGIVKKGSGSVVTIVITLGAAGYSLANGTPPETVVQDTIKNGARDLAWADWIEPGVQVLIIDPMGNGAEMIFDEDAYVDRIFAHESQEFRDALKQKFKKYEENRRNYKHADPNFHFEIGRIIGDWWRSGSAY